AIGDRDLPLPKIDNVVAGSVSCEELRDPHAAVLVVDDADAGAREAGAQEVVAVRRGRPEGAVRESERRGVSDVFADLSGIDAASLDAAADVAVADVVPELAGAHQAFGVRARGAIERGTRTQGREPLGRAGRPDHLAKRVDFVAARVCLLA